MERLPPPVAAPIGRARSNLPTRLKVLEHAGLITGGREAQWRRCRLRAGPPEDVADWVAHYRRFWEQSSDRLDDYLHTLQGKEKKHGRTKR